MDIKEQNKITDQELKQTVDYLQNLICINTTNPPGNEIEACKYLVLLLLYAGKGVLNLT